MHFQFHADHFLGLGLHLQSLAQRIPNKFDLHETHLLLHKLGPYQHLHRIFRLCTVHAKRNIRTAVVSDNVRHLMRSLICMTHHDWNGTLRQIEDEGGKIGKG